jgi:hypothetical protein
MLHAGGADVLPRYVALLEGQAEQISQGKREQAQVYEKKAEDLAMVELAG